MRKAFFIVTFLIAFLSITGMALNATYEKEREKEQEIRQQFEREQEERKKEAQQHLQKRKELAKKAGTTEELISVLEKYAASYELPFNIVYELVKLESSFNPELTSYNEWNDTYDRGLLQLNDNTSPWLAEKVGIKNFDYETTYDPEMNVKMGLWYLSFLHKKYQSWHDTLTAYNRGMTGLKNYVQRNGTSKSAYSKIILSYLDQ